MGAAGTAALGAGLSIGGSMLSNSGQNKTMGQAGQAAQVNLDQLSQMVQKTSQENAMLSRELQNKLDPWVNPMQTNAAAGMQNAMGPTGAEQSAIQSLTNRLQGGGLLNQAAGVAGQQLALGGRLPQDVQNAALRASAAHAGAVGGGQLGLGRDMGARDLGLSSLALLQQRLANAQNIGGMQGQQDLAAAQGVSQIAQNQFQRPLQMGALGMQYRAPNVGLDPSAMANISMGNANNQSMALMNQAYMQGQQGNNMTKLVGQLGSNPMVQQGLGSLGKSIGGMFGGFGGGNMANEMGGYG